MRTRHLMALFTGVLILAIILPISLSIWQAARQAKMQFYRELDDYSNRIVVRTLQVADQAREALREADAHTAASCSPEHLLTLRRIAYTHHWQPSGGDAACVWLSDTGEQVNLLVVEPGDNAALCLLAQPGLTLAGRVMQLGDVIKIMNDRLQPAQSAVSYSLGQAV